MKIYSKRGIIFKYCSFVNGCINLSLFLPPEKAECLQQDAGVYWAAAASRGKRDAFQRSGPPAGSCSPGNCIKPEDCIPFRAKGWHSASRGWVLGLPLCFVHLLPRRNWRCCRWALLSGTQSIQHLQQWEQNDQSDSAISLSHYWLMERWASASKIRINLYCIQFFDLFDFIFFFGKAS